MIRIQTFKYFGRSFSDSSLERWFCPADGKVYDTDEMKETFGFRDESEIDASGSFIKLFKTDIPALKRRFLESYPDPRLAKRIQAVCNTKKVDFNIAFNICAETEFLHDWNAFEDNRLEQDAVSWCRANGLAYTLDKENE